ncbi:unnamed protein product, partial [Mesorhabditis spiculigera]
MEGRQVVVVHDDPEADCIRWVMIFVITMILIMLFWGGHGEQPLERKPRWKALDWELAHDRNSATHLRNLKAATEKVQELCSTKECTEAAGYILHHMDPSVDPCVDFHEFACGRWNQKNKLGFWETLAAELHNRIQELINTDRTSTAMAKARIFLEHCEKLNISTLNDAAQEYAKKLGEVRIIGQQLEPGMKMPSITDALLLTMLHHFERPYDVPYRLHHSFIGLNGSIDGGIYLFFNDPIFIFDFPQYKLAELPEDWEQKRVEQALQKARDLGFSVFENAHTVPELVQFYKRLKTELYGDEYEIVPFADEPELVTLGELQDRVPALDWEHYIGSHFPSSTAKQFRTTTLVQLGGPVAAFEKLSQILVSTPRHVLQHFFFVTWAQHIGDRAKARFTESCHERFSMAFPKLAEHLIVKYIIEQTDVPAAKKLAEQIRQKFQEVLDENQWLENSTRQLLKQKLSTIPIEIGYNQKALNVTDIDKYYEKLHIPDPPNLVDLLKFEDRAEWLRIEMDLGDTVNSEKEPLARAAAWNTGNRVVIPIGLIQPPFFAQNWPLEFIYGGIGEVIGHELTHSFDDPSKLPYDADGDHENFQKRADCLVDQFGRPVYRNELHNVTITDRGEHQLHETLADNNGLRVAWRAYNEERLKRFGGRPPKLPGLQEYTNEQLFFLAHAQFLCGRVPDPNSRDDPYFMGEHPPLSVRLNGSLQNFEPFAVAFKCKINSPMNPMKKCRVWRRLHRK